MMNGLRVLKWKTQNCIKPESLYLHHNSQFCTVLVCLCLCQREREKERERRDNPLRKQSLTSGPAGGGGAGGQIGGHIKGKIGGTVRGQEGDR